MQDCRTPAEIPLLSVAPVLHPKCSVGCLGYRMAAGHSKSRAQLLTTQDGTFGSARLPTEVAASAEIQGQVSHAWLLNQLSLVSAGPPLSSEVHWLGHLALCKPLRISDAGHFPFNE